MEEFEEENKTFLEWTAYSLEKGIRTEQENEAACLCAPIRAMIRRKVR